ncbi:hypothetical protein PIB30_096069, partial [Stylosanthes scabra]|nr:hypothetical protein [Stylosanthes scabra]
MGAGDGARQPRQNRLLLILGRFDGETWKSSVGGEKRREMGAGDGARSPRRNGLLFLLGSFDGGTWETAGLSS